MFKRRQPVGVLFQVDSSNELVVEVQNDDVIIKTSKFAWGDALFFLPFIAFALVFIVVGLGTSAVGAYQWLIVDDEPCTFSDEEPLFSGDGTAYCQDYEATRTYRELETSEDRFRFSNGEAVTHFRWSSQGDYLVIAEIYDDGYATCDFYLRASELPTNWSTDDLTYPYLWETRPSWCDNVGLGADEDFAPTDTAPFGGERLYRVFDSDYGEMSILEYTNATVTEQSYLVDSNDGLLGVLMPFFFTAMGVFMLRGVDDFRPFRLTFNRPSNALHWHKAFAGTTFSGWSWEDVELNTMNVKRTTKEIWYGGDDDGGYYSTEAGDLLSVHVGGAEQQLVFFIGSKLDVHSDPFLMALAQAVGIKAVHRIEDEVGVMDQASLTKTESDGEEHLPLSPTPETAGSQEHDVDLENGSFWSNIG